MKLNVDEMYDVVETKGQIEPRPIRMGDVLEHRPSGDPYFIFAHKDQLVLGHLATGGHYSDGVTVHDRNCLTREEALFLCSGNSACFRLLGPAGNVLTIQDPGE